MAFLVQDNMIPLRSKQLALTTITQLIQLPPRISQLTRCSLLKASHADPVSGPEFSEMWCGHLFTVTF
jgi:hypothetical protein